MSQRGEIVVLQAYQGYFENGHFITAGRTMPIPERRQIIVTVLDEAPVQGITHADSSRIDKRLAIVQSLKGIIPKDIDLETARVERRAARGLMG
jgi:hypothetical protein